MVKNSNARNEKHPKEVPQRFHLDGKLLMLRMYECLLLLQFCMYDDVVMVDSIHACTADSRNTLRIDDGRERGSVAR